MKIYLGLGNRSTDTETRLGIRTRGLCIRTRKASATVLVRIPRFNVLFHDGSCSHSKYHVTLHDVILYCALLVPGRIHLPCTTL